MKYFGLDIGTTTVSAVVVEDGRVIAHRTLKNGAFIQTAQSFEKIQDVAAIRAAAMQAVEELLTDDIAAIGITGQMHGIVYLDKDGSPLSPLYTWQDGRGNEPYMDGLTYAEFLHRETGYAVATGYGLVTHFFNLKNGLVPADAVTFCTIHDYITMLLCDNKSPLMDASDAASFGMFDVQTGCFDTVAIEKVGIDTARIPSLSPSVTVGMYRGKIPVFAAIGDNQASFLGATGGKVEAMLVNIGTGSQFSAYTRNYLTCDGLETRPFPGIGYLIVGAPLCGGRAYALLEQFLRETVRAMTGTAPDSCYPAMDALLADTARPDDLPTVTPLFQGTRQDPALRGSISDLTTENFTPRHLIWGMLEGMVTELHDMYLKYKAAGGIPAKLMGSGNGLRQNPPLQEALSRAFGQSVTLSDCQEEAAVGAAMFAAANL